MGKYYYDFGYFFNRKDSGSIRVTTNEPLNADDIDACVKYTYENDLIEEDYIDNIIYVNELTKEEAIEMGFEDVDE